MFTIYWFYGNSASFKSKVKNNRKTPADGNKKDVEIAVLLKYFSNFWRILRMLLINCQINAILTWSSTFVITNSRDNLSLVARYSLKFTHCSLIVGKLLVTCCKIHSLFAAEIARCKKLFANCCKIRRLLINKLLVAKNHLLLAANFVRYSLHCYLMHKITKKSQLNLVMNNKT